MEGEINTMPTFTHIGKEQFLNLDRFVAKLRLRFVALQAWFCILIPQSNHYARKENKTKTVSLKSFVWIVRYLFQIFETNRKQKFFPFCCIFDLNWKE